ncbi:23S rRNA (uracil(1939)-C(5))-methyltransferase RlmD [Gudongella sp. DL1XJH-153]|uniref:23S rRNA (uracil(1939)-C(5))-methyltransferase RlmD n=1 Tax=Gudongella sp. DL1XJH-153 TaxID=3409804 RepID=UPI003BB4A143
MNIDIGDIIKGEIIDFTHEGKGVMKVDGFPIFVEDALIGDVIKVKITQRKKSFALGTLESIEKPSIDRVEYKFDAEALGGGVPLIGYSYEKQLEWKRNKVIQDMHRIGGLDLPVNPVIGMGHPFRYRNHSQVPIGKLDGKAVTGYYKRKSSDIVPMEEDHLQPEIADSILKTVRYWIDKYKVSVYDRETKEGILRHIGIRTNENNESMVILVTTFSTLPYKFQLVHMLVKDCPGVISVYQNINPMDGKFTYGRQYIHLFGKETLTDYIGDLQFKISPDAFFQINRQQVGVLYGKARDYLQGSKEDIVYDLYSGIGTISLFVAGDVSRVIGIESVKAAVKNAEENAKLNSIENVEFHHGKAEELFPWMINRGMKANKIILDPPRKGCEKELLQAIIKLQPNRIVYVSCNPSTLARDLKILVEEGYSVKEVQPVDMFPHTVHVEMVVLMSRLEK